MRNALELAARSIAHRPVNKKYRDAALADAKYWERFIEDYKLLSKALTPAKSAPNVIEMHPKELTWPQMRSISREILEEKGIVENAAAFAEFFADRGYIVQKDKLSACLTHAKSNNGGMAYDKTKGGWFLTEKLEQAS